MIGYWVYKFEIEDRDIGVVDFVPLDEGTDINLPFVTLCFFPEINSFGLFLNYKENLRVLLGFR